jgi:hypothetical protein
MHVYTLFFRIQKNHPETFFFFLLVTIPEVTSVTWLPEVTWPEEAMSGSGPIRKYVLRMPGFSPRFFLSSSATCWIGVFSATSAFYDQRKPPF